MATTNKNFKVKNGLDVNGEINASAIGGDEGGQINLEKPATGTTLSGNVAIDVYQNKIRFFDSGGSAKGAYIDLSAASDGVGSNLLAGGGAGITSIVEDTTPQLGGDLDTNGNDITGLNALIMDTTPTGVPTTPGTISWDADNQTLQVVLDGVNLQVGQEHIVRVKNNSTSVAIPDRTLVMFAGATGDTVKARPAITADAQVYPSDYIIGITTEEIPADGFGFVTQFGFINHVDTSAWTVGTLLYPDPATPGGFITTRPAAPAWQTPIAAVTKQSGSAGRIFVRAIPGIKLGSVEGVEITSPADNNVLAYDSTSGTWVNQTAAQAGLSEVGHTHSYTSITGLPTLASVATTGAYSDLSGKPTLATVATSGAYSDLSGKPTLASVATSGSYTDLSSKPTLGTMAAAATSDYAALAGATFTGAVAANGGITNNDATKVMTVAAGYASGTFSGTKVVMTATATGQTAPTVRPGGGSLQAGDIWISW